jgi:hypothetical protein
MTPGNGGTPAVDDLTLDFVGPDAIELRPRSTRTLTVTVTPAGAYTIRFSLLPADNDSSPDDATLNRSEAISDAEGRASVVLTGSSSPGRLLVRAQAGNASTVVNVTVSSGAVATFDVRPIYSGKRAIDEWVASVYPRHGCDDVRSPDPPEPAFVVRAPANHPLTLIDIPAEDRLSIAVNAGGFASGCRTLEDPWDQADEPVTVLIDDLPVNLGSTVLDFALGLGPSDRAFTSELDAELHKITDALRGEADDDVGAILDGMSRALSRSSWRAEFAEARDEAEWDQKLASALGRSAPTYLEDAVTRWSRAGRSALFSSHAFEGELTPNPADVRSPSLELKRIGQIASDDLDVDVSSTAWSSDASDTLALATDLSWSAGALHAGLLLFSAEAETGEDDLAKALASLLSCANVAATLGVANQGDAADAFIEDCDSDCIETLCRTALHDVWQNAEDALDGRRVELSLRASGSLSVGTGAQATALDGIWAAELSGVAGGGETRGTIHATVPRTASP